MCSGSVQSVSWFMRHYVPCYGALVLCLGSFLCPMGITSGRLRLRELLLVGLSPFLTWAYVLETNTYMTLCCWGCLLVFLSVINRLYKAMHELGNWLSCSGIKSKIRLGYCCFQLGMVAPIYAFVGVSLLFWLRHGHGEGAIPMPNIYSLAAIAGNLGIGKWLYGVVLFILLQLTVLTGWLCFLVHKASCNQAVFCICDDVQPASPDVESAESVELPPNERI